MLIPYRTLLNILSILAVLVAVVPALAQAPAPAQAEERPSAWWYPLGNPEATRNNPVPTASQQAEDLKIKWRTGRLKNSPVLLVGGIRTEAGANDQQIVGMEEGSNRVTILTSAGFVDTVFGIAEAEDLEIILRLTGLFNTTAPSVIPVGNPNAIGIEVRDWSVDETSAPFGLLANGNGSSMFRLGIRQSDVQKLSSFTAKQNRFLSIAPIAAYTPPGESTPIAIGLVSQDRFVRNASGTAGQIDTMINSIRKYSLVPGRPMVFADPLGTPYFLAQHPHNSTPAMFADQAGRHVLSLSTRRYANISPAFSVRDGILGDLTSTDIAAPINLDITATPPAKIAYEPGTVAGAGTSTSHFAVLTVTDSIAPRNVPLRFFTERVPADSNNPILQMTRPTEPTFIDNFVPAGNQGQTGWIPVIADVDGTAPGHPTIMTTEPLVNNPGNELILTTQPDGSGSGGKNWVYIFRYNIKYPIKLQTGANRAFYYFTRQLTSGRVLAAGDLVADRDGRQELLLVDGNAMSVLQLKSYALHDDIQATIETSNKPFTTLATFTFGAPIVSVAIADLEGDGENDIVVSTTDSTYAVGKIVPDPYEFDTDPNPFNREYCPSDTIRISWTRNVGSEDTEIEVRIVGESLNERISPAQIQGDSIRFRPDKVLQPGEYRIVVSNLAYSYIANTSEPFTVAKSMVGQFDFATGNAYAIGGIVADTVGLACVDSAWVQRSVGDSTNWEDLRGSVTRLDEGRLSFADTLRCPEITECGIAEDMHIYYRLVTEADTLPARAVQLSIDTLALTLDPEGGLSRKRRLEWESDAIPCDEIVVSISGDGGATWSVLGQASKGWERFEFDVPDGIKNAVTLCVQCSDVDACGNFVRRFAVSEVDFSNYVYPNPFDPEAPGTGGGGAEIVYVLDNPGTVSITVYDASRSIVREIAKSEERPEGRNRGDFWDGKNIRGEYVANGTYICVVSSSGGERIILPILIVKRQ